MQPIAILSALVEEQKGLIGLLHNRSQVCHANRVFWLGDLYGRSVVLALSKIGKVAAATTACALIERFGVQCMVFTGVAGGLDAGVQVGDVVVGQSFVQHDLDASPLFPQFEVPLYGKTLFDADKTLTSALMKASQDALADTQLRCAHPAAKVHLGLIASGDRFISGAGESDALRKALFLAGYAALAVEMEGAAVAQTCYDHGVPFAVVRTISDRADDFAYVDFPAFVEEVASKYALAILEKFIKMI